MRSCLRAEATSALCHYFPALVNELIEAKQQSQLRRIRARWERYNLIAIDEVGYVPMTDLGTEFLFQVVAE